MSGGAVTVRVFAGLRERIGVDRLVVPLGEAATAAAAVRAVFGRYPEAVDYEPYVRTAVNARYAPGDRALVDGDEVALITPVSGG